jgi:hypothetical protein
MDHRLRWWQGLACVVVVLGLLPWSLPSGTAQVEIALTDVVPSSLVCWHSPGRHYLASGDSTRVITYLACISHGTDPEKYDESTILLRGRRDSKTWMF